MLKRLNIKNYAIIKDISIEFSKGFNVFTGETGAGKSIIVGALLCLAGQRADSSVVKTGSDKSVIEGIFDINDKYAALLTDASIDFDDELIVRRVINKDGKNSIFVNDNSVTLNFLNKLFKDDIDIHSQKENFYLLNANNHLRLLDIYAEDRDILEEYHELFNVYDKRKKEFDSFLEEDFNLRDLDYFKYSLEEINNANLSIQEEEDLLNREKYYKSFKKDMERVRIALSLYNDDRGIKDLLYELRRSIADNELLKSSYDVINDLYYSLEDEMNNVSNTFESFDLSEEEINHIEERLYEINRLKRKYQTDIKGILELKAELIIKINKFEDRENYIQKETEIIEKLKEKAFKKAKDLSKIRKEKALQLEKNVIKELHDLLLSNVQFKIDFQDKNMSFDGIDDVEFMISLNAGESLKALNKVASGGEISRVMLGLKTIFTRLNNTSLVVFDEIDNGVSGKVAFTVGKKMHDIAKDTMVIAITHLAPVAAFADNHLYIYKSDSDGITSTTIKKLNDEEIISELAMISSSIINGQTKTAAQELIERANSCK